MQEDGEAYNTLGQVFYQVGRVREAEEAFLRAVTLMSESAEAQSNLAVLYWEQGNPQKAVEHIRRAVELDPQNPDAVVNCAMMQEAMGEEEQAIELLERYLTTHKDETIRAEFERIRQKVVRLSEAVAACIPDRCAEAASLVENGEFRSAVTLYGRLLRIPDLATSYRVEILLGLGDISARVGRATLAEHFFAEAIFADTLCEGSYLRLKEALVKRVTSLYRVSIVIPTYRQVHDLQECITSLREHSFYPLEIIVVSEPDDTETATYLDTQREAPDLIALRNDTRLGSVKSINKGFKVARGDIVGLLNDDVRVMPAWDLALVDIFERVPSAGSCSSLVLNPDGTIQSVGMYISHKSSRFPWIGQVEWVYTKPVINHSIAKFPAFHLPRECDYGYFPFLKRECFEKIGRVDERFRHYFVDPDIGYQVQQLGYKNILCPTSVVFHYHLGDKDTPEREAIGRADWEEFSRKWALRGMTPGEVKGIRVMSVEEPMTYLKTAIRQLRDAL